MSVTPEIGIVRISSLYLPTPVACDLANGLGSLDTSLSGLSPSLICFGSNVSLSRFAPVVTFRHARLATWRSWYPFHDGTSTRKIGAAFLGALDTPMLKKNLDALEEYLRSLSQKLEKYFTNFSMKTNAYYIYEVY